MTTVFGLPAVSVEQPGGEVTPYVLRPVPASGREWRAWECVKPDGTSYRVSEFPSGRFACSCPAFKYRARRRADSCKHCDAIRAEVTGGQPDARPPHETR